MSLDRFGVPGHDEAVEAVWAEKFIVDLVEGRFNFNIQEYRLVQCHTMRSNLRQRACLDLLCPSIATLTEAWIVIETKNSVTVGVNIVPIEARLMA